MAAKKAAPAYVVEHTVVGTRTAGEQLSEKDFPEGTDFDRLVELGAIRKYDADRDGGVPGGVMTLAEANRGESPPTMPNVGTGVITSPEELRHALDPRDTFSSDPIPEGEVPRPQPTAPAV